MRDSLSIEMGMSRRLHTEGNKGNKEHAAPTELVYFSFGCYRHAAPNGARLTRMKTTEILMMHTVAKLSKVLT